MRLFLTFITTLFLFSSLLWAENLALNKPAIASSLEKPELLATNATDGDMETRWASEWADPQWIMVDLGTTRSVNGVVLAWEYAFGREFDIQVSTDSVDWKRVYSTSQGRGGTDSLTFDPVQANYVRLHGTRRGTRYCYSLYEFEVHDKLVVTPKIVYPTKSIQIFEKVTGSDIDQHSHYPYATSLIDYDMDNYLDYLTITPSGDDFLFKNDQLGHFKYIDHTVSGLNADGLGSGIAWGDWDNDGDPDPFVPVQNGSNILYRNEGHNQFTPILSQEISKEVSNTFDAAWGDYDNDGWLDLMTTNCKIMGPGEGTPNLLFHNNGDGSFSKVSDGPIAADTGNNASSNWIDYDDDGDLDLFTTDFGDHNKLYQNQGNGQFLQVFDNVIANDLGNSISSTWGDYDNDGDFDLYVTNGQSFPEPDFLYTNNGDGTFTRVLEGSIAKNEETSWNAQWGDVDNDGDLDLFVATITIKHLLYLNNGDGTFIQVVDDPSVVEYSASSSASLGDIDNDGDLDLVVAEIGEHYGTLLYTNKGNDNHWINIRCSGTHSNKSGIGAKIYLKATINGQPVWQTRHISASNGFRTQSNGLRAHFGLGDATTIDSVKVIWPSGQVSVETDISVDQFLTITELSHGSLLKPVFKGDKLDGFSELTVQFTDFSETTDEAPIQSWEWDFENDGTVDSNERNPKHTFSAFVATSFSVKLTVSNGSETKSFTQYDYIDMKGHVSILKVESNTMDLGLLDAVTDTALYIYNKGDASDEISITLKRYKENVQFNPAKFTLAGFDSQRVSVTIDPMSLKPDKAYVVNYKINSVNNEGPKSLSNSLRFKTTMTLDVSDRAQRPHFSLQQNYPNPFNPTTTITFSIPQTTHTTLSLYNTKGQLIQLLMDNVMPAGEHSYVFKNTHLASGVYFCKLKSDTFVDTKKFTLLQ